MDLKEAYKIYLEISKNIKKVIIGKDEVIEKFLAAFFGGGHILLEDIPGTGKTTLAKTLSKSIDCNFNRIQFTPDLLPSDILGVSIFNQKNGEFYFRKGPIFTNILLADEINRASPRTQSALLESMEESQVSTEGKKRNLSSPFFVIATQNPIEYHGTYPLPEAQMDRFMVQLSLGYVSKEREVSILKDQIDHHPLKDIKSVVNGEDILRTRNFVHTIRISEELMYYIVEIVSATREAEHVALGASPRASIALLRMSQALALINNMDFVIPEHIQSVVKATLSHRIMLDSQAKFNGITAEKVLKKIVENIEVPV
ncbi:MAG: AAA family ATPase [Fusobacteriota bacterium]